MRTTPTGRGLAMDIEELVTLIFIIVVAGGFLAFGML